MSNTIIYSCIFFLFCGLCHAKYEPTWDSIDSRPLPTWYDEAKLGIFIHWGVFSVPSYSSEWFWHDWKANVPGIVEFMFDNYKPDFTYADFAKSFTAEFFSGGEWADIFNSSGAKYVVFVSKHHEGYTNYPSKYSFSWNSMDVGPNRDIVGELAEGIRSKTNLRFGVYHSMYEWFNPLWIQDFNNNCSTQDFVNRKTLPELYELVEKYKPEIVWSDGDWDCASDYWKSKDFLAWLYNDSPVKDSVVINDRWGKDAGCRHGGFYTCGDRFNPGHLVQHKWENAMTLDKYSWGYRRNARLEDYLTVEDLLKTFIQTVRLNGQMNTKSLYQGSLPSCNASLDKYSWGYRRNARLEDYLTVEDLLKTFIQTVSCGGNMLMNVGPRHDGIIDVIQQERLRQMGQWLAVNGEAIYATKPWTYQNDTANPNVWYTQKTDDNGEVAVYAIALDWPTNSSLYLGAPSPTPGKTVVSLLGMSGQLQWTPEGQHGMQIKLPSVSPKSLPCQWAWAIKLESLAQRPKSEPLRYQPRVDVNKPVILT